MTTSQAFYLTLGVAVGAVWPPIVIPTAIALTIYAVWLIAPVVKDIISG